MLEAGAIAVGTAVPPVVAEGVSFLSFRGRFTVALQRLEGGLMFCRRTTFEPFGPIASCSYARMTTIDHSENTRPTTAKKVR
jgi:hypothetical protein